MKLSDKLLKLRLDKNLSQTDVAKAVNTSRQSISNYERGLSVPDAYMIMKLAKTFKVSMGELYKEVEEK